MNTCARKQIKNNFPKFYKVNKINVPILERFLSQSYLEVVEQTVSQQQCVFSQTALKDMLHIAKRGYPDEVCGLLIGCDHTGGWQVNEVRQVDNINQERAADRFQLDPAGYQSIDSEFRGSGQEIIGVFHSHPDCPAKPSPTDLTNAWEGFVYPIVSVVKGQVAEVHCWILTDDTEMGGKFQKLPHHP